MKRTKMLMLTDHSTHTAYDSVYALPREISAHSDNIEVYAASRAISAEHFICESDKIDCFLVDEQFTFQERERYFNIESMESRLFADFDIVFFRLDRPITDDYLRYTRKLAPDAKFVNSPEGLIRTASKSFLENFRELCPPFIIANSLEDIYEFNKQFPVVLKPLDGYGGGGLIKIVDFDDIYVESEHLLGSDARRHLEEMTNLYPLMAMKYLQNVNMGDKRIVVVAGECLGAVLRVPKQESWLCNLAQGATSAPAEITPEEQIIVEKVDQVLSDEGITLYGIDTLVDDDHKRVLSEINVTNVGGFVQIQETSGRPVLKESAQLILNRLGM